MNDKAWLDVVRRLEASYSVGGRDALGKMTAIEIYVLYAEKMAGLNDQSKKLAKHPQDELAQLRKGKLESEVRDVGGFLKENCRDFREMKGKRKEGPEPER